jgi:protein AbiQ
VEMRFQLVRVSKNYADYLREYDDKVPFKQNRPFVGIVLMVGENKYYAPLTSPKKKHKFMKDTLDFIKIKDGEYGAINLNNMIPVQDCGIVAVNLRIGENDSEQEIKDKILLQNQRIWCVKHKNVIEDKAKKLHDKIYEKKAGNHIASRCCDFKLLEEKASLYLHG